MNFIVVPAKPKKSVIVTMAFLLLPVVDPNANVIVKPVDGTLTMIGSFARLIPKKFWFLGSIHLLVATAGGTVQRDHLIVHKVSRCVLTGSLSLVDPHPIVNLIVALDHLLCRLHFGRFDYRFDFHAKNVLDVSKDDILEMAQAELVLSSVENPPPSTIP